MGSPVRGCVGGAGQFAECGCRAGSLNAGAAGPSEGLRAGRSSGRTKQEYTAACGRRGHATFGSWPTRQSDDRDSEPDYLLRRTRHGRGMTYNSGNGSFYLTIIAQPFRIGKVLELPALLS